MRTLIAKLQPTPWLFKKLVTLAIIAAVGVAAFCWGRSQNAEATPPNNKTSPYDGPVSATSGNSDYSRRIVAYLYGVPVSREELGEYLIARFGVERLEFMLNRKIVETEAAQRNIYVTNAEIQERFKRDMNAFGTPMDESTFVNNVLRRFNKTAFEWKEDVIRPKLLMEKIVRPIVRASLTDKDLQEGFEARYGPKVECRMIVLDKNDRATIEKVCTNAKKSRAAFLEEAKKQVIPNLANAEGKVPAIHKHFGDAALEDAAFRLKEGETSALIEMKDGTMVLLLCEKHLPADVSKRFEQERAAMMREVEELRLLQRIPQEFEKMKERAKPSAVLVAGSERTASIQVAPRAGMEQQSSDTIVQTSANMPPAPVQGAVPKIQLPEAPPATPAPTATPAIPERPAEFKAAPASK